MATSPSNASLNRWFSPFLAFGLVARQAIRDWSNDNAARLGAALAFYAVFSLVPLLVVVLAVAGLFYEPDLVRGELDAQLVGLFGDVGARAVQDLLLASKHAHANTTIISLLMLLWGATSMFTQLQDSLNAIWQVRPKTGRGVLKMLRDRILSFIMVVSAGLLLLVLTVISTVLQAAGTWFSATFGNAEWIVQFVQTFVSFLTIGLLFAIVFKYVPDVVLRWSDVWIGALVTSVLFIAGKWAVGLYLAHGGVGSSFGAAASLAVVLVWIYYSAQIVVFGAEFTQAYARMRGSTVAPADNAETAVPDPRRAHSL